MKIAIISDIHGNKLAFDNVIKSTKQNGCEKIFCLGDIALGGYDPNYIIEKCRELQLSMGRNFEIIQGNTDKMIANYSEEVFLKVKEKAPSMAYALKDDIRIINKQHFAYLGSLPETKIITLWNVKIQLVHGSVRRQDENMYPYTPVEEIEAMCSRSSADVIFAGHTHIPCGFTLRNGQNVVNAGSVGRSMTPDRTPVYAIMDIDDNGHYSIEHKFVEYDNKKVSKLIASRGFEQADELAKMYLTKND